jgi:diguanylate cyclase (GGDEF)-like protein
MDEVAKLAGLSYDPRVVEVLRQNYQAWEQQARGCQQDNKKLSVVISVPRGAPAAGYDLESGREDISKSVDFLNSIGSARHEAQILHEMSQDMVSYLALDEMLSVVGLRLRKLIPHDTFAVTLIKDAILAPEFVSGDEMRLFSSLRIPLGAGISGWVAENRKPILNGNPSVEPGYLNDPTVFSVQRSMIAVPLECSSGVVGVLSLVSSRKDAFTQDHLRILLLIASKLGQSIQNSLRYRSATDTSMTDYLTGLPNARSLFTRLGDELQVSSTQSPQVAVLVCDLDGFKNINDRYGHLTGNRVLQEVAATLKEQCRPDDYVARMGGDEFVLIVRDIHPGVDGLVHRLTASIEQVGRRICGEDFLSASIGYSLAPEDGLEPEQLLACADRRMYQRKEIRRPFLRRSAAGEQSTPQDRTFPTVPIDRKSTARGEAGVAAQPALGLSYRIH